MNTELLNLLALVVTWITALLVFFTLLEMVRQRKATYKPDIVVSRSFIHAYMARSGLPNLWFNTELTDQELEKVEQLHSRCSIPVHNLGLGAARDIEFIWRFDRGELLEKIEFRSGLNPLKIDISTSEDGLLRIEIDGGVTSYTDLKQDLVRYVYFVLPASTDTLGSSLRLPSSYIYLVSIFLLSEANRVRQSEEDESPLIDLPSLELIIKYRDIGGSKHSKKYQLQFSISYMMFGEYFEGDHIFSAFMEQA